MNIWKTKTPAQIDDAAEHTQLKKNLTALDLAALGIGSVVGTGIFVATGQGAQLAGPGVLLSFIIAAVTCGFCALTYSELACMFPVRGAPIPTPTSRSARSSPGSSAGTSCSNTSSPRRPWPRAGRRPSSASCRASGPGSRDRACLGSICPRPS